MKSWVGFRFCATFNPLSSKRCICGLNMMGFNLTHWNYGQTLYGEALGAFTFWVRYVVSSYSTLCVFLSVFFRCLISIYLTTKLIVLPARLEYATSLPCDLSQTPVLTRSPSPVGNGARCKKQLKGCQTLFIKLKSVKHIGYTTHSCAHVRCIQAWGRRNSRSTVILVPLPVQVCYTFKIVVGIRLVVI